MGFQSAYKAFIGLHRRKRRGESLRRLHRGHGHAERTFLQLVWWPAFGSFHGLHPEYEVIDFDGRHRYLDFAYLTPGVKLALEIDGFGPHVTQLDRWQFSDQLRRQNQLILDGWALLRFSYDQVSDEPRSCQQVIQQYLGRWSDSGPLENLNFLERSVIKLALTSAGQLTPGQVSSHLSVTRHTAYKILHALVEQGWLAPAAGRKRIRSYRLVR